MPCSLADKDFSQIINIGFDGSIESQKLNQSIQALSDLKNMGQVLPPFRG